jgi:hypothetical protein
VPKDSKAAHDLLVEAAGYRSEQRQLLLSHDQELVLHLHQLGTSPDSTTSSTTKDLSPEGLTTHRKPPARLPKTSPKVPEGSAPPAPAPEVAQPHRANCSPPFYYDDRGIKKYRAECL